ncbi:16S rRNA (uracil(1498)-N(3))-methyltransferase [Microlunatus soli]|uniref:Ribosomal RNA small subunit methyltransferase E n=1 Tax=Microlunatus soli TaxID=630515 RepID=A0A1H1YRR7_9ACTN|nr:16S rRNA (uracil(1498)-N(3))-methyltransferase [Microlunatus soli]SDT24107.1 16S rRNA (uracil1498-N3)-methyltransferase [Microlunatus soli]
MTDPVFLSELADPLPEIGTTVVLDGSEGRHAATVRRIGPGESVIIADGAGRGVRGTVVATTKTSIDLEVTGLLTSDQPPLTITVAQALAKGDRSDIALEMITELGAGTIIPWQASRSIVRWQGERATKSHARWLSTVREATKQSRRLRVPEVTPVASTKQLTSMIADHELTLVLHEEATERLADLRLPQTGAIMIIVGPEGGIAPSELDAFTAAGGRSVVISDGVLRTSTAAAVAIAGVLLRGTGTG